MKNVGKKSTVEVITKETRPKKLATEETRPKKLATEETIHSKTKDDKILKRTSIANTPRDYIKKPTSIDVYSKKNAISNVKTTKPKAKDSIKSTSSVSLNKTKNELVKKSREKDDLTRTIQAVSRNKPQATSNVKVRTAKDLPFVNVTVNSPPSQRKLDQTIDLTKTKTKESRVKEDQSKDVEDRQRKKTRTLKENEVKLLTAEGLDNNKEMKNLTQKLTAKPKAFFINLDDKPKLTAKVSDDENYSYEDDFESYESDFESYHSDSQKTSESDEPEMENDEICPNNKETTNVEKKTYCDEERMLDSGSFDLKDAIKAKVKQMDGIVEVTEDTDKHRSLTDEGFLDMSNSSGVSSMKTVTHTEILERPIFIDFKKSKQNKRKHLINEKFRQRAKDLLSMITLHEMAYNLFEMTPIPYDVYMATFGKTNYVQKSAQTFDDGVDEEIQTEEVLSENKWTQNPVKFSKDNIHLNENNTIKRNTQSIEDFVSKFTCLINDESDDVMDKIDADYKSNPLRIYLEQKDGVGNDAMLPIKKYNSKINNVKFSYERLGKFLKKMESKICHEPSGRIMDDFVKSKYSFSEAYKTLHIDKNIDLKGKKVINIEFSDTKSNLFLTVHEKGDSQCLACLWDISIAKSAPLKTLVAIENVALCRFRGNTEGFVVGALQDGSIHLWDLSEEPTWSDIREKTDSDLQEVKDGRNKTQTELDREWNLQNRNVDDKISSTFFSASAYTSSPFSLQGSSNFDMVVGLEFSPKEKILNVGGGKKILGQVCSLQRNGILTIWNINQEKHNITDIGRAYWSKIRLEKYHTISLLEKTPLQNGGNVKFNLNLAKKRITRKRIEKEFIKSKNSRRLTAKERVASINSGLQDEKILPESWEFGLLCYDLKIIVINDIDNYLIAKNCGEVLACTKNIGGDKINTHHVAEVTSCITSLQVGPNPSNFLAGTDTGVIHLYSTPESRVLLTLDSRITDKGRHLGSVLGTPVDSFAKFYVKSIHWSRCNPCCIFTLSHSGVFSEWDLMRSDIHAQGSDEGMDVKDMVLSKDAQEPCMALLTKDGTVEVHILKNSTRYNKQQEIFDKYVSLL